MLNDNCLTIPPIAEIDVFDHTLRDRVNRRTVGSAQIDTWVITREALGNADKLRRHLKWTLRGANDGLRRLNDGDFTLLIRSSGGEIRDNGRTGQSDKRQGSHQLNSKNPPHAPMFQKRQHELAQWISTSRLLHKV